MALEANSTFGNYRIGEVIGEGGMGQVYRATDTNLKRDVAIKVLPEAFASDADRLQRFQREAETLASLNHPNIGMIFGLEKQDGIIGIVMELVEGPTLADRIAQGPVPPEEALRIARQIIDGLEAAHEKGIVHRDLKPANIKIKDDGQVKILDFGIAKPGSLQSSSGGATPTLVTPAVTEAGIILGTAAYMSPEQARGKIVDQRTDIWAFGCLLFEMLTGQPAFMGEDVIIVMASILRDQSDLDSIPAAISPAVRHAIRLCLEKDPKKRLHHIGDVRLALAGELESGITAPEIGTIQNASPLQFWAKALPLALIVAALVGVGAWQLKPEPAKAVNRFSFLLPADLDYRRQGENTVTFSPDGRSIVLNTSAGLYLRSLDTLTGRIIPGTEEDLDTPFFSADSQSLAYWTPDGAVKRIAISGGAPVVVARGIGNPLGASWHTGGTILVADQDGIKRFPATGGTPELVLPVDGNGELFQAPRLLPDGDTLLYSVGRTNAWDEGRIEVLSLANGERQVLIEGGSDPRYLSSGHLLYALGSDLFAQAFDAATLSLSGSVVPVVQGVQRALYLRAGLANVEVSDDGTLVYQAGTRSTLALRTPVWVDLNGQETELGMPPCMCLDPKVSPDGTRIAFARVLEGVSGGMDIWVWSLAQGTFTRLTFDTELSYAPVWSPDGEWLAWGTQNGLYMRRADGTGQVQTLVDSGYILPFSWSTADEIIYTNLEINSATGADVGVVSVTSDQAPRSLLASTANESRADLSPDGRWLAYQSDESGIPEIYVRPFPDVDSGRWQVSQDGGQVPQWSADSGTLFFAKQGGMLAAAVVPAPSFVASPPQVLFPITNRYLTPSIDPRGYAVAPEGERLLMLLATATENVDREIVVVQNWTEELKRLVPVE